MRTLTGFIACICGTSLLVDRAEALPYASQKAQMLKAGAQTLHAWYSPKKDPECETVLTNSDPLLTTIPATVHRDMSRYTVVWSTHVLQCAPAPCRRSRVAKVEPRPRIRDPTA